MNDLIEKKFEQMGAKVKVREFPSQPEFRIRRGLERVPRDNSKNIRIDFTKGRFDIQIGKDLDVEILDVQPKDKHLLLMAKNKDKSKFLCGHDEKDWFVAAIPEKTSVYNVKTAMEALKPKAVVESQRKKGVKSKKWNKRKNEGFIRQGEWFFVPSKIEVNEDLILKNEPLRRGRAKPHVASELFRTGGTKVYQSRHGAIITEREFKKLKQNEKFAYREMVQDMTVYVRGSIKHPDHKTIHLDTWHRVEENTERKSNAMKNVAFLD